MTTATSPRTTRPWSSGAGLAAVVLVAGFGGGVLTEVLQGVLRDPWAAWANSVAAWSAVGFAVGAVAGGVRLAAAASVATQLLLVSGYYVAQAASGLPLSPSTVVGWLVAAVVGGVVFGVAGRWWRSGDARYSVAGVSLISGVLVAEGWIRAVHFPWQGASGAIMIGAGLLTALALGRTWGQRLAVIGLLAVVVPLGWAGMELVNLVFAAF